MAFLTDEQRDCMKSAVSEQLVKHQFAMATFAADERGTLLDIEALMTGYCGTAYCIAGSIVVQAIQQENYQPRSHSFVVCAIDILGINRDAVIYQEFSQLFTSEISLRRIRSHNVLQVINVFAEGGFKAVVDFLDGRKHE